METVRIVLLHFGIAVAMAAAFGAAHWAAKTASKINLRLARADRRRRSREVLYWRALSAQPSATDD
jgi:type IV secretory pathway VirB3-like protein